MPFPMVHLCVAAKILEASGQIANPGAFLLGSIAPDSVHFRPSYHSGLKLVSHLCTGEEKWGFVTDNKAWTDRVLEFHERNKLSAHKDFIHGYCAHILTDIQNNIEIWTPFRLSHHDELGQGKLTTYHQEGADFDRELYDAWGERQQVWRLLKGAKGMDPANLIRMEELDRMKHHILHVQYAGTTPARAPARQYVTEEIITRFIDGAAASIGKLLFGG